MNNEDYFFSDFTEDSYRKYIQLAKENYRFILYPEIDDGASGQCLWRHDIDYSPQRALKLAQIENAINVRSTYFVLLHAEYYNALEKENTDIFRNILSLGHTIGLHFDLPYFGSRIQNLEDLSRFLLIEKEYLENIIENQIDVFSFHNPGFNDSLNFDQKMIAGMINVYSKEIKENFSYTSDSFCIWKNRRLLDVLTQANDRNIQILTHPVCWSEKESSPHERILRSIEGRKEKTLRIYMERSERYGRKTIDW